MDSLAIGADATPRTAQPYRERLLAGMAQLCAAAPRARQLRARDELGAVFLRVLSGADLDARRRFAALAARADWVSPRLALRIALDDFEVAQAMIAESPVLGEAALREVLAAGSAEHRAAVARRGRLSPGLADAVVDTGEPLALVALAGNGSADISAPTLRRLVEASRRVAALRPPLVRRRELTPDLARLLAQWVGDALRDDLALRFDEGASLDPYREPDDGEAEDTEARLLSKLEASGQLRPGFLMRTLREGKLSLFEGALAALGRFPRADVARALRSDRPDLLALACAAVGLDRSVFPTILELVRGLNEGAPRGGGGEALEAALLVTGPRAAEAFRAGLDGL